MTAEASSETSSSRTPRTRGAACLVKLPFDAMEVLFQSGWRHLAVAPPSSGRRDSGAPPAQAGAGRPHGEASDAARQVREPNVPGVETVRC